MNDRRFLNLYLLEHLRRQLQASDRWRRCRLTTEKNMRSGVYLAVFEAEGAGEGFRHADQLAALWQDAGASVWFHVELWDGVLARGNDDVAGVIQLRCQSVASPNAVTGKFREARPLRAGEKHPAKVKAKADSFYLLARPLLKKHLTRSQFVGELDRFADSFRGPDKTSLRPDLKGVSGGFVRAS